MRNERPVPSKADEIADLGTIPGDALTFGGVVSNAHALASLREITMAGSYSSRQMISVYRSPMASLGLINRFSP